MKLDLCFFPKTITKEEFYQNLSQILHILKRHRISLAYVFGSILIEDQKVKDLDIGIYVKNKTRNSIDIYNNVYFDICDLFKADNIDVVILNHAPPAFKYEVISTGKIIYSEPENMATEFIEKTLFEYQDTQLFREEYGEELLRAVREGLLMAKRRINIQRIKMYISNLDKSIRKIKSLLGQFQDSTDFKNSEDPRDLCIHHLRITLETVLDIARHIIAVKGFGIPDMNRTNMIDILGQHGVIPYEFSSKIRGMAGMRNAIVHVYWDLDYERIYEMITSNLHDFETFAKYILQYVEKEGARPES